MKKVLILLLLTIMFSACQLLKSTDSSLKYFEGKITYARTFESLSENWPTDYLNENIGGTTEVYFKNGNIKRLIFNQKGELMRESYLDPLENKSYMKEVGNDTLYIIDHTIHDTHLTFSTKNDTTILGMDCTVVHTEGVVAGPGFGDQTFDISSDSYLAKDFKLNPKWYKDFKEANYGEMVAIYPYIVIHEVKNEVYWVKTISAIETETRFIHDSIFDRPMSFQNLISKRL